MKRGKSQEGAPAKPGEPQRKRGRPSREEAAKRKIYSAIAAGETFENDTLKDLEIACTYDLIVHRWGFPRREAADAIGRAALAVLNRSCPDGLALSGDRVRQLVRLHPFIRSYRSVFTKEQIINHRPRAIEHATKADLEDIAQKVLRAGGNTPHEWEELCII